MTALRAILIVLLVLLLGGAPAWAIPSCSLLTGSSGSNTTDATSFATGSVTLTANRFYVLWVAVNHATVAPVMPTVTGASATWVGIDSQVTDNGDLRLAAFRTMVSSNQSGALTIDFAGATQQAIVWAITECTGIDTSGTNGSGAIVTPAVKTTTAALQTTLTLTFAAYGNANNRPIYAFGGIANNPGVHSTDWTELSEVGVGTPNTQLTTGWRNATDDTTVVLTTTGSAARYSALGLEVKNAAAAAGAGPLINGTPLKSFVNGGLVR